MAHRRVVAAPRHPLTQRSACPCRLLSLDERRERWGDYCDVTRHVTRSEIEGWSGWRVGGGAEKATCLFLSVVVRCMGMQLHPAVDLPRDGIESSAHFSETIFPRVMRGPFFSKKEEKPATIELAAWRPTAVSCDRDRVDSASTAASIPANPHSLFPFLRPLRMRRESSRYPDLLRIA